MTLPLAMDVLRGYMQSGNLSVVMAAMSMAVLPVILLFLFAQKFVIEGVTMSGHQRTDIHWNPSSCGTISTAIDPQFAYLGPSARGMCAFPLGGIGSGGFSISGSRPARRLVDPQPAGAAELPTATRTSP